MQHFTVKTIFAYSALALAVCLGSGQVVAASGSSASSEQSARQHFDIPAQPLAGALNQFSRQSGWEVGYTADLARDKRSAAVRGELSPAEAILQLLAGTGLGLSLIHI